MKRTPVLVVDDNLDIARTTALILNYLGYAATTAGDGLEAIQKVEAQPYDVIVMDIKMPRMGGMEACQRILEMRPEAVVVMTTAFAVEGLVQQVRAAGARYVLYKPLDVGELIAIIERHGRSRAQGGTSVRNGEMR